MQMWRCLWILVFFAAIGSATGQVSSPAENVPIGTDKRLHVGEPTKAAVPTPLSSDQIKDLIQKVAENDLENNKKVHDYTYSERQEEHKLDGKGAVTSTETKDYDVLQIYGDAVYRLM